MLKTLYNFTKCTAPCKHLLISNFSSFMFKHEATSQFCLWSVRSGLRLQQHLPDPRVSPGRRQVAHVQHPERRYTVSPPLSNLAHLPCISPVLAARVATELFVRAFFCLMACHFPWQSRDRSGVSRNDLANDTQGCRGPSQVAPFRNQMRKLTCSQISMRASRGVCRLHAVYLSKAKNLSIRHGREPPFKQYSFCPSLCIFSSMPGDMSACLGVFF